MMTRRVSWHLNSMTGDMRRGGVMRGGFTLMESLVALAMIAIVLPVIMQSITIAIGLSSYSRSQSEAATLAKMKMDEIIALNEIENGAGQGNFGEHHPGYEWRVETSPWSLDSSMTQLTVTVQWSSRGQQRDFSVSTLVVPE